MSYSTEDCKNFLIQLYPNTNKKDWKRVRKYKNENRQVARDFVCGNIKQTIVETIDGLQPYIQSVIQQLVLPTNYKDYLNKDDSEITIAGENEHKNTHLTNDFDKFKHVLRYGIDWDLEEGSRSLFDFSKNIDFNLIVLQNKTILDYTVLYVSGMLDFFYSLDETYIPHHCSENSFHDSVPDLINVLTKIKKAYISNSMPLIVNKKYISSCFSSMNEIKDLMDEEPDVLKKANNELKKLEQLLNSFQAV